MNSECIGIDPEGLELRLISRQYLCPALSSGGCKCPFFKPFELRASDFLLEDLDVGTVAVPPDVRGSAPFFSNNGLLLLVRDFFSGSEFDPSVPFGVAAGEAALPARVAERRVLPTYSSLGIASGGEGEMTSGVFGMGNRREDMMKKLQAGFSGRQGKWMRPKTARLIEVMVGEEASKKRAEVKGSARREGLPLRIMTDRGVLPAVASASVLRWAWCFLEEATLALWQIRSWREVRRSLEGHEIKPSSASMMWCVGWTRSRVQTYSNL